MLIFSDAVADQYHLYRELFLLLANRVERMPYLQIGIILSFVRSSSLIAASSIQAL